MSDIKPTPSPAPSNGALPAQFKLTADELRILTAYRALDRGGKAMAMSTLEAWARPRKSVPEPTGIRLATVAGKRVTA